MGIMAVDAVDPLHVVVGMPAPEDGGVDIMTLQADLLWGSLKHECVVLGVGIMTLLALSSSNR
jgi:hypothetical protein